MGAPDYWGNRESESRRGDTEKEALFLESNISKLDNSESWSALHLMILNPMVSIERYMAAYVLHASSSVGEWVIKSEAV